MKNYFCLSFLFFAFFSLAQYKVNGKVLDDEGNPLKGVQVLAQNNKSVITNSTGEFVLVNNIPMEELEFSKVGYNTIKSKVESYMHIVLPIYTKTIEEVTLSFPPSTIIKKAITNIHQNYSQKPFYSQEFRQSTVTENDSILFVQETAVNVARSYNTNIKTRYYLLKNRNFTFTDKNILLKSIGGLDLIKNLSSYLNKSFYKKYHIKKLPSTIFDGEDVYVLEFYKDDKLKRFDFKGRLYINKKDYAIIKIEMEWGDGDKIVGNYKKIGEFYYMMSGIGTRIKKHSGIPRISSTEMVNTQISQDLPTIIEGQLVSASDIISKYSTQEYDIDFWTKYNSIIPDKKVDKKITEYYKMKQK